MTPVTDLSNIDPDEVAIVKRGAIRRVFDFFKADETGGEVELLKENVDALTVPLENEAELVAKWQADGLDEAAVEAKVVIARLEKAAKKSMAQIDADENMNDVGGDNADDAADDAEDAETQATLMKDTSVYTDTLGPDKKKRARKISNDPDPTADLNAVAKNDAPESADDLGGSSNATKEHVMGDSPTAAPVMKEDGTWDVSGVEDPSTRSFYENVLKSLDDAKAEGTALRESVKKAEERASDLESKLVEKEIVAKAEGEFSKIAKSDELVPVLKAAKETLPAEQYEALEGILKSANARIEAGDLFAELGRSADPIIKDAIARGANFPSGGGDAWDQIVEKANAMVLKDGEDLTESQRIDRFLKTAEGKRLYADYRAENGAVA